MHLILGYVWNWWGLFFHVVADSIQKILAIYPTKSILKLILIPSLSKQKSLLNVCSECKVWLKYSKNMSIQYILIRMGIFRTSKTAQDLKIINVSNKYVNHAKLIVIWFFLSSSPSNVFSKASVFFFVLLPLSFQIPLSMLPFTPIRSLLMFDFIARLPYFLQSPIRDVLQNPDSQIVSLSG